MFLSFDDTQNVCEHEGMVKIMCVNLDLHDLRSEVSHAFYINDVSGKQLHTVTSQDIPGLKYLGVFLKWIVYGDVTIWIPLFSASTISPPVRRYIHDGHHTQFQKHLHTFGSINMNLITISP